MTASRPGPETTPGLYIHIPYCARKCVYCSFNSFETGGGVPAEYVHVLGLDMERSAPGWEGAEFGSIYIGGGTPSLLEPEDLARILSEVRSRFTLAPDVEITLEANPSSLGRPKPERYLEAGANRLSVGLQSLAGGELRFLGRLHSRDEALDALDGARAAGFANLSCDVMIGVPGQTVSSLETTLAGIVPRASHISCYLLSVDEGTPLRAMVESGAVAEQTEEDLVSLFEAAASGLCRQGLTRYEISNWARPGFECRHNLMYWSRGDYLGIGAGASSHRGGVRSKRLERPDEYMGALLAGSGPVCFRETVTADGAVLEEIMLRLRTMRGLDLEWLAGEFGCDLQNAGSLLRQLHDEGLLVRNGKEIQLTAKGILVSDAVICNLSASLSAL
jgi:oxygen-independent coproporphyrinogen-3 oxidase